MTGNDIIVTIATFVSPVFVWWAEYSVTVDNGSAFLDYNNNCELSAVVVNYYYYYFIIIIFYALGSIDPKG